MHIMKPMAKKQPNRIVESGDFSPRKSLSVRPVATSRDFFEVYALTYECFFPGAAALPRQDAIWIPHPVLGARRGDLPAVGARERRRALPAASEHGDADAARRRAGTLEHLSGAAALGH